LGITAALVAIGSILGLSYYASGNTLSETTSDNIYVFSIIIFPILIGAASFPPSRIKKFKWKLTRKSVSYCNLSISTKEALLDAYEGIFFFSPCDVSDLKTTPRGISLMLTDKSMHIETTDDWNGSSLDNGKQAALFVLLSLFRSNRDFRDIFAQIAKPMKRLKQVYVFGVLLPLSVLAGFLIFSSSDSLHPVAFKGLVVGSGVFLAYDYRRRSRRIAERIANKTGIQPEINRPPCA